MNTSAAGESIEPNFKAISDLDAAINLAHSMAANSVSQFVELVKNRGNGAYMAKLRFRDPELSDKSGKDQFLYLWLTDVYYHEKENILSGIFFEVPAGLKKWHQVGERLGFESEDVFDWMINTDGHVQGGYTIRVHRSKLSTAQEKAEYDEYIGISSYEKISQ